MAQQPGKGADVTFWNAIVGIYNCCTPKQMTLLESWDKTGQDRFVLKSIFWVSKLDIFLVELDLTLGQIWKWISPSNSTSQMTHQTCVTRYPCFIFMQWSHLTWPWPWTFLGISILLTWHLRHPFSSILTGFGLAAASGLVSATDKAIPSQLWLLTWPWPDICLREFKDHIRNLSLRAFDRRLALLAPPIS